MTWSNHLDDLTKPFRCLENVIRIIRTFHLNDLGVPTHSSCFFMQITISANFKVS